MSRYRLNSIQNNLEVHVGWDNPLDTFFATVCDIDKEEAGEEEYILLWLGGSPGEIKDISELIEPLKPYAILDEDIQQEMRKDYSNRTPPSRLQMFALKAFSEAMEKT